MLAVGKATGRFLAEDEGDPVGAAWFCLFDAEEHGFGFIGQDVPELKELERERAT